MRTPQLLCRAAAATVLVAAAACNRADTNERAQQAASEVRTVATRAGDEITDAWVTTQVQAKYFADRDVKARYIDVSTHDRVVTLKGYVQNEPLRQRAVAIAKNTSNVRDVQDQLLIGQAPANRAPSPSAVATTGAEQNGAASAVAHIDDARITAMIQSKYFLDAGVKGRRVDVDTRNGVVTLRGEVASESERAQALRIARETEGVQRVEDMLTVDASLDRDTSGADSARSTLDTIGARLDDGVVVTKLKAKLLADSEVNGSGIDVSSQNGIVTLEGQVPNAAAKARALSLARETDGVTQVVDRLTMEPGQSQKSKGKGQK